MNKVNLKYGFVAFAALSLSVNVSAADLTCNDIEFTPEAFAAYEFVDKACLAVVERDGGQYAKLTATIVQHYLPNTFVRYKNADGTLGPRHKSNLGTGFQTMIDGKPVKLRNLAEGQEVNVYVGKQYWVNLLLAEEIVEEMIVEEIVEEAIVEEAIVEEMIMEEEMEAELPTTAGPLPWLALFGSLFLLLGGALRFSRKQ